MASFLAKWLIFEIFNSEIPWIFKILLIAIPAVDGLSAISRYAVKSRPIELENNSASPTNAAGIPYEFNDTANFLPSLFVLVRIVISFGVIEDVVPSRRFISVPSNDWIFFLIQFTSEISVLHCATIVLLPSSLSVLIFFGVLFGEFSSNFEAKCTIFWVLR